MLFFPNDLSMPISAFIRKFWLSLNLKKEDMLKLDKSELLVLVTLRKSLFPMGEYEFRDISLLTKLAINMNIWLSDMPYIASSMVISISIFFGAVDKNGVIEFRLG